MTSAHSAIIKSTEGLLYTSGSNSKGQLGQDTDEHASEFSKIGTLSYCETSLSFEQVKVKMVASGSNHTLFIDNNNLLWGFGSNSEGQLGVSSHVEEDTFDCKISSTLSFCSSTLQTLPKTPVSRKHNDIIPLLEISTPQRRCISDQNVETLTRSRYVITHDGTHKPTKTNSMSNLDIHDTCGESGKSHLTRNTLHFYKPTPINTMKDIECKTVDCGAYFSAVIDKNGSLWTCGSNEYGQLCLGDNNRRDEFSKVIHHRYTGDNSCSTSVITIIDKLSTGSQHILVIDDYGIVWCSGDNRFSQLGIHSSHIISSNVLVRFGINNTSAKISKKDTDKSRNDLPYSEPIVDVFCGYSHSLLQSRFSHKIWMSGSIIPLPSDRIGIFTLKLIFIHYIHVF